MAYLTTLGIVQIVVGLLNIITGILFAGWGIHDHIMMYYAPFWLGGVFLACGIMTIIVDNCPFICLSALTVILNEFSGILAMTAVGLYSWDLMNATYTSAYDISAVLAPEQRLKADFFLYIDDSNVTSRGIVDVTMAVFAILQLCVNFTLVVMSLRPHARKHSADDSQVYKQLPEETTGNHYFNSNGLFLP